MPIPRISRIRRWIATTCGLICLTAFASFVGLSQDVGRQYDQKSEPSFNRQRGINILRQLREVLKDRYYDQTFHGINIEARFKEAEDRIKTQDKNWQIYRTIASVIDELNDSHTIFLPPDRLFRVEYGFTTMMIGAKCFIVDVKKGSDADAKGVTPGDEVLAISGVAPTRASYNKINYIIYGLDPQEVVKLQLLGQTGKQREVDIKSKFISPEQRQKERKKRKDEEQAKPYTCREINSDLIACKLRTFSVDREAVDKMMKEVRGHKKLILDLRGNGGGYVDTELYLTSYFFDHDVAIGTENSRKKSKDVVSKSKKDDSFKGDLGVLIDSESASSSEIFARVIQLEKRGTIYGDTSMGAVMTAEEYGLVTPMFQNRMEAIGGEKYYVSFFEVTVADFVMRDGGRLEGTGVAPDIPIGPSPTALVQKADPVLAYAAGLLGAKMTAEQAGELHFLIPKSEEQSDKEGDDKEKK